MKTEQGKRKGLFLGVLIALLICLLTYGVFYMIGRMGFETSFYQIDSAKVDDRIRIVEVADLHNWTFGEDNADLIERIRELEPDLIAVAGDLVMAGNSDVSVAVSLCEQMMKIAPVYYTYGNHENELVYGANIDEDYVKTYQNKLGEAAFEGRFDYEQFEVVDSTLPDALKAAGVTILNNGSASLQVGDVQVDIAGVDTMSGTYFPTSAGVIHDFLTAEPENVKLIVTHYPVVAFEGIAYQEYLEYDALLSGHRHGGIIRIPGLGGMIGSEGLSSLFEGYDSGVYETDQGSVVISRGLGQSNLLPRVNNTPELVVIDIE